MAGKAVILGGTGKMGRWFAGFLKDKGFEVALHSRAPVRAAKVAKELDVGYIETLDAVSEAGMVIVSTTISSTPQVIRSVSKKMRPNTVLFDIASVKGDIIDALEEATIRGVRAISVHPMFGPGAKSLGGKHVIVIPVGDDAKLVDEIAHLFEGAQIHVLPSGEAHDAMIALTLSLPHVLNMAFGKTLTGANIPELLKCAGTTFTLQLMVTEAVYSEDPDLYYEIQSQNEVFSKVLDVFLEAVKEIASAIKRKDREIFVNKFKEIQTVLANDPAFVNAYTRFYKAYEAIA